MKKIYCFDINLVIGQIFFFSFTIDELYLPTCGGSESDLEEVLFGNNFNSIVLLCTYLPIRYWFLLKLLTALVFASIAGKVPLYQLVVIIGSKNGLRSGFRVGHR